MSVHIIGATGRSGAALCAALRRDGVAVTPVVRNAAKWRALPVSEGIAPRLADLGDSSVLRQALRDAVRIVSCAHARHAGAILAAAPTGATFVFLGSTRRYSRWPDAHGDGVKAGEAAFMASGRDGVMLHPTMIYGAEGEDNVRRLAALLARLPFAPLPAGGSALVQPIHQSDVTAAIRAALARPWPGPHKLVIAGPTPLPYADFLRLVARAAGLRTPRVIPLPALPLIALSVLTVLPGLPRVRPAEIRRLLEDKAFDIAPMRQALGVAPMTLEQGLRLSFGDRA